MNVDTDQLFFNAIRDAIREGISKQLIGYNSPLEQLMKEAINKHSTEFSKLLDEAIKEAVCDDGFRKEVKSAVNQSIARTLVQRFGGEIEKQVNALKSDPTTRAKITVAINDIVESSSK